MSPKVDKYPRQLVFIINSEKGVILISIFKEDNVFSMTTNLPYGPPVNTDIDYHRTFLFRTAFCKCCDVSCAIFV